MDGVAEVTGNIQMAVCTNIFCHIFQMSCFGYSPEGSSPAQVPHGSYASLSFSMRLAQENLLLECALSEITYQTFALKEQLAQNISLAIFTLPTWGGGWLLQVKGHRGPLSLSACSLQQPFSRPGFCSLLPAPKQLPFFFGIPLPKSQCDV